MTGRGVIVVVVGPSGAGKDSVIDHARKNLAGDHRLRFVRRYITRPEDGVSEDHKSVDHGSFSTLAASGGLALHWQAHGLFYGIPADTLNDLDLGRILIVNGSRAALPAFRDIYGDALKIVHVTAPKPVLAERLAQRGRETADSVMRRLERSGDTDDVANAELVIVNDRTIEEAGEMFVSYLRKCLSQD